MSHYISSIRKIGIINSGMFDTLNLNFDVAAVHLVGANNVGKTSLIALIQFLFFPSINEMTFIKSTGESMNFYFRPEGSYILFEVRTITGSIRTVGIYGTGGSDSRVNFVFNGSFDIKDFLNTDYTPVALQDLQASFFARDFVRFDKFERYEEALLGLHTRGEYNVPMFELSKTNFRLLRKLMQGLLRLDRIDAADVQQFLIRTVEKGNIKTRFNLLQDFEQKYRHINQLRIELRELEDLKPVVARYQKIVAQISAAEVNRQRHAERLFHLSSIYLTRLTDEGEKLTYEFQSQEDRIEELNQSIKALVERVKETKTAGKEVERQKDRFETLMEICRHYSEPIVKQKRDELTHARVELQNALAASKAGNCQDLKRQFNSLKREYEGVLRQLQAGALEQVWIQAGFDGTHRALLKFLVANDLTSLRASEVLKDHQAFIDASACVVDYLDNKGHFKGFGLDVPKSLWFIPETEQEPLDARKARLENDMMKVRDRIDIAENEAKKEQELAALGRAIKDKETILKDFNELQQLTTQWQSLEKIEAKRNQLSQELNQLYQAVTGKEKESRSLREQQRQTHFALKAVQDQCQQISRDQEKIEPFDTASPENLNRLTLEALRSEYHQVCGQLDEITKALTRYNNELSEPKADLEMRYDRAGADIPFERWIELKLDLANEIEGLEAQLQREYEGVFTVVRAKLSKITQAYANVEAQVAQLNKAVHNVRISNIEQIGVALEKTDLLDAMDQTIPGQLDIFAHKSQSNSLGEAHAMVEDYFNQIKQYGNEINLKDMFRLKFSVLFKDQPKPVERYEIHRFESNGTETGVKIVIYLGLIGLLQERKNIVGTRIPFFLDEVGSIDSDNLKQLIDYCARNNFLPIFASPEIRKDISHNYLFRRNGSRSYLETVIKISKNKQSQVQDEASILADHTA
jgi:DNA repair exonuclease SbcCD ATPase subunit